MCSAREKCAYGTLRSLARNKHVTMKKYCVHNNISRFIFQMSIKCSLYEVLEAVLPGVVNPPLLKVVLLT